ncbi:MAG: YciI family protein [Streptosporangiaceae bacterium]
MPRYVLSYHSPTDYTPSAETRAAWTAWFDGMGDQLVDQGKPVIARVSLGNCDPDSTALGGYSVIQADDMEAAAAVAKGCPHLDRAGGVEVGQLGDVPGSSLVS